MLVAKFFGLLDGNGGAITVCGRVAEKGCEEDPEAEGGGRAAVRRLSKEGQLTSFWLWRVNNSRLLTRYRSDLPGLAC